jgi:hypothetical protein
MKPKRISVRPGNELEGGGIVVWIYHRKVQIQLQYPDDFGTDNAIADALRAWYFGIDNV